MKCLIYCPTVGRGGVRRVLEALCAEFSKLPGWEFGILGQTYDEIGEKISYPAHWHFQQIRPVDRLPLHPHLFQFIIEKRRDFFAHLKEVAPNYDVIFCVSPWWAFDGDEKLDTPIVSFVPDFAFDHIDMGKFLSNFFRSVSPLIAHHSAHTIFPSDFQRKHGERNYGFKGSTIYFSTDIAAQPFRATTLSQDVPAEYVLAFHCYGHKGAEIIIRAQELARMKSGLVPPLVLAGLQTGLYLNTPPENAHVRMIQNTIRDCQGQIGRDVFILGQVPDEDISLLHANATVAVTATRSEGAPNGTMLEAIRTETPIICTALDVFTEQLSSQEVGFFPVDDYKALADRLVEICEDRAGAAVRASKLRERFAGYTMRDVAQKYLEVFKEVVDGNS